MLVTLLRCRDSCLENTKIQQGETQNCFASLLNVEGWKAFLSCSIDGVNTLTQAILWACGEPETDPRSKTGEGLVNACTGALRPLPYLRLADSAGSLNSVILCD